MHYVFVWTFEDVVGVVFIALFIILLLTFSFKTYIIDPIRQKLMKRK